jgi:hypothetical protein
MKEYGHAGIRSDLLFRTDEYGTLNLTAVRR